MSRSLLITFSRIGDAALSTGVLEEIRRRAPEAPITVACGQAAAPLFRAAPGVDRVAPIERAEGRWRRLWSELRRDRYGLAVDLRGSMVTSFIAAKERRVLKRTRPAKHRLEEISSVFGTGEVFAPRLHFDAEARAAANRHLPADGRVLAMGPGGRLIAKRWPPERFAELGRRLAGLGAQGPMTGATVALLGGAGDRAITAEIAEVLRGSFCRVADLAGELDLLGCAALLERASLFVGNDTGLMHVAAAAGAPTLGLFGPSSEARRGPIGPLARALRGRRTAAQVLDEAGDLADVEVSLLEDLPTDAVEAAVLAMLAARTG